MSLKVGDRVKGVKFKEGFNDSGLHFNKKMEKHIGKIGTVLEHTKFHAFKAVRIQFENGEQWVYPEEVLSVIETKKEKVMKKENNSRSISELRIPAYAVVSVEANEVVTLAYSRDSARGCLREVKKQALDSKRGFKIVKLTADKFVR